MQRVMAGSTPAIASARYRMARRSHRDSADAHSYPLQTPPTERALPVPTLQNCSMKKELHQGSRYLDIRVLELAARFNHSEMTLVAVTMTFEANGPHWKALMKTAKVKRRPQALASLFAAGWMARVPALYRLHS